jgi:transcriptional regulator with XRE-family HTH domain
MERPKNLNIIGQRIRELREENHLTQDQVAAKCQVLGFDLTRGTLAKIESRVRAVSDHEIPFLAKALNVGIEVLFPKKLQPLARKPRNPRGTSRKRHK